MNTADRSTFDVDHRQLSALFDVSADGGGQLWEDDELGAVLRHQLAVPIRADLRGLDPKLARRFDALAEPPDRAVESFGGLLAHPNPPVEWLKAVKDFAKTCRARPHGPIPHEIATVLYFACLAAALVRGGARITSLADGALVGGFRWVADQPWVDDANRALAEEALRFLGARPGARTA